MRRFAIGDIHGCMKSLRTLIELIDPESDDELIFLGDYIDRGPDSRDVVDQIIALQTRCQTVTLRGNHEIMLLGVALGGLDAELWLGSGGVATVTSYGGSVRKIPESHLAFFQALKPYHETDKEIFIHANYESNVPIGEQREEIAYWKHLTHVPAPHCSGKRAFVGHTPQPYGQIMDLGYLVCLDTYCFGHGYLTAMNLDTDELIQVDYHGHPRRDQRGAMLKWAQTQWGRLRGMFSRIPQESGQNSNQGAPCENNLGEDSAPPPRVQDQRGTVIENRG